MDTTFIDRAMRDIITHLENAQEIHKKLISEISPKSKVALYWAEQDKVIDNIYWRTDEYIGLYQMAKRELSKIEKMQNHASDFKESKEKKIDFVGKKTNVDEYLDELYECYKKEGKVK